MCLKVMKRLFKSLLILFFPICANGQINTFHSKINKPFTHSFTDTTFFNTDTTQRLCIGPRFFVIGSANKSDYANTYLLGTTLSANVRNKLTFISHFDYLGGNHNAWINEFQDSLGVFPDFGADNKRWQANIKYKINKFITADIGNGKHFIGNGYRSLLLSHEHAHYPYLKFTTEFGRVRYYNLYTTFMDIQDKNIDRKKHASIHFLNFRLTQHINIGVFEGVVWRAKDDIYNRGFDVEYLNPVVFYRPVEFSKHSPDNVLMGTNVNVTFAQNTLYGQVLLDDLNIARQKDRDENYSGGFFQNKFAYQFGCKTQVKGVNLLLEFNQGQPYTYAHKEPMQSYTHMNQALAHPLGANFKEVVVLADYRKEKWKYSTKLTLAQVGLDSLETHYGQNIFESDYFASTGGLHSYGNFNGQGVLTKIHTLHTEVAYSFKSIDVFASVAYKKKKSDLVDQTSLWYSVGIRTFPFSTFTDY